MPDVEQATNLGGEFAGVRVPLNSFFSSDAGKDAPKEDATPEDDKKPEGEEPPDPEGLDLGSIDILIPTINTVLRPVDGVFVVDPTKELRNGEIVDLDTPDAPRDAFGALLDPGDRDDLAALTLDLDGLLTYATGGAFPPLEFGVSSDPLEIGPASFSVDFFYNLPDVELRAALPLVQEFTLTPAIAQKVDFFDPDTGAVKLVQIETVERQLLFDVNGVFQSAAVEARLRELAAETPQVERDLDLFVDFAAGVPGSFTADVGGVTGRLVVSRDGGPFEALTLSDGPIARSAPILAENQNVKIDVSGLGFAYELIDDRGSAPVSEFIPVAFDPTDSVYRFVEAETVVALDGTDFIVDLEALNIVYDGGETEVVVTSQARPMVDARTGLEFDLSLLLEGLAATAHFNASVDVGPVTIGGSIGFDIGPLFSERFPLLNLDIVDIYNDSVTITDEASQRFLLGGEAPPPDFGDAIVGTDQDDKLSPEDAGAVDAEAIEQARRNAEDARAAADDAAARLAAAEDELAAAEAALSQAQASFSTAQGNLGRIRALFNAGVASQADLRAAERNAAIAQVAFENAISDFEARAQLADELEAEFAAADAAANDAEAALAALPSGLPKLTGTPQADVIVGLDGEDVLEGLDGDDTLFPGLDGGVAEGGEGEDTLDFSDVRGVIAAIPEPSPASRLRDEAPVSPGALGGFAVTLNGDGASATQTAVDPNGAALTFTGVETVRLTDASDYFETRQSPGGSPVDLGAPRAVFMLGGDDRAYLPAAPTRFGPDATLLLDMGAGDDAVEIVETGGDWSTATLRGGAGDDTLLLYTSYDLQTGEGAAGATVEGFETLVALGGAVSLGGDDRDNRLSGTFGDDMLTGRGGDDTLQGGDGRDLLIGGAGADLMQGGSDTDTVSYADASSSAFIQYDASGQNARGFRGEAQGDRLESVEHVVGTAFSDIMLGNASTQTFEGGDGDDRLIAQGGNDSLLGQDGDDLLIRSDEPGLVSGAMLIDGGDGIDIAAFTAPEGLGGDSSTVTGTVRFFRGGLSNVDRTISFFGEAEDNPFLRARIGEGGADGVAQMIAPEQRSKAVYTTGSVKADAAYVFDETCFVVFTCDSDLTAYSSDTFFSGGWTWAALRALDETSFTPQQFNSDNIARIIGEETGREVRSTSYSATYKSIGGAGGLRAADAVISTDVLRDIEGLIGTSNDDELFGSSGDDVLFGNGSTSEKEDDGAVVRLLGGDYIEAGAGDDRLGFGEAQNLQRVTRFPGSGPSFPSQPGSLDADDRAFLGQGGSIGAQGFNFETVLSQLDPDDADVGASRALATGWVNTNRFGEGGDQVGSFLWGGAGRDTLDLRFDRGLEFRAESNPTQGAFVDLDFDSGWSAGAPINAFTGQRTVYGYAAYGDIVTRFDGSVTFDEQVIAHTFGVENVIGTDNRDIIVGDPGANVIEGAGGADLMDGAGGADVLTYARAGAGVRLTIVQRDGFTPDFRSATFAEKQLVVDNAALSVAEAGEAAGDLAVNFERIVTTAFADRIDVDAGDFTTPTFGVYELGAGDDVFMAAAGGVGEVQAQDGDDYVEIGGALYLVNAGAGDDTIVAGDGPVFQTTSGSTVIDGGAGDDVVRFVGTGYTLLETSGPTTYLLSQTLPGGETHQVFIRDVERLEFGDEVVRLGALDPVVDPDKTLTLLEDAREPFDLGARAPAAEADAGASYRILSLPESAAIGAPGAAPLNVGAVIDAATLDALMVTPGQNYASGVVSYERVDLPADEPDAAAPRLADLPAVPPVPGVSLGVTAPAAPDGAPVDVIITELPSAGEVFYLAPHAELAAMGLIHMGPVAVSLGDVLTPEQAARLHYRAAEDASGPAGALAYVADVGDGFRDLAATTGTEAVDPAVDGRAGQRIALEVLAVDDAPTVRTLLYPMSPGGLLEGRAAAADPEGDAFTLAVEDGPAFGALSFSADGAFTYAQDVAVDFDGAAFVEDSFTVRATQGDGLTAPAAAQIIQILNPDLKAPIVFDVAKRDVFFDENGDPIALGGLPADDEIVGHEGPDELFGFGGDDTLKGGMGPDRMTLGKGRDMVMGLLEELDGDIVEDFDEEDAIVVQGVSIRPGAIVARPGSAILEFDEDGDGVVESTLKLEGDYAGRSFEVLSDGADTTIRLAAPGAGQPTEGFTITVAPVNDAPVGRPDSFATTLGAALTVPARGVLANDDDAESDPLTALLETTTANGVQSLAADGGFTYTPDAGFVGADGFTYRPSDGADAGDPVTVAIEVAAVLLEVESFAAGPDAVIVTFNQPVDATVLDAGDIALTTGGAAAPFTFGLEDGDRRLGSPRCAASRRGLRLHAGQRRRRRGGRRLRRRLRRVPRQPPPRDAGRRRHGRRGRRGPHRRACQ